MAVTQLEIARRVGLDVSSVNKILNRRAGPVFRKDTIKQVFKVARELGYDFSRLKYHHKRGSVRRPRIDGSTPGAAGPVWGRQEALDSARIRQLWYRSL